MANPANNPTLITSSPLCTEAIISLESIATANPAATHKNDIPEWTTLGECPVDLILSINFKNTPLRESIRKFGGEYIPTDHSWRVELRPNPNGMDVLRRLYSALTRMGAVRDVIPVCEPKTFAEVGDDLPRLFARPQAILSIPYPLADMGRDLGAKWDAYCKVWRADFKSITKVTQNLLDKNRMFVGLIEAGDGTCPLINQSAVHNSTLKSLYDKKYYQLSNKNIVMEMAYCHKNSNDVRLDETVVVAYKIRVQGNFLVGRGFQCAPVEARRIWERAINAGYTPSDNKSDYFLNTFLG